MRLFASWSLEGSSTLGSWVWKVHSVLCTATILSSGDFQQYGLERGFSASRFEFSSTLLDIYLWFAYFSLIFIFPFIYCACYSLVIVFM